MGDIDDELDLNNPPFPLTSIDREILATKDEDYHRTTWDDLKQIIGTDFSVLHVSHTPTLTCHKQTIN